jgi:mono/diheme cytochrome c family protein
MTDKKIANAITESTSSGSVTLSGESSTAFESARAVLVESCASCHSHSDYQNYNTSQAWVDAGLIVPGDINNSLIYRYLKSTGLSPATMPKDAGALSATDRAKISTWISGLSSSSSGTSTTTTRRQAALSKLTTYCASCHGVTRTAAGGIGGSPWIGSTVPAFQAGGGYTTDAQFVTSGLVVAGDAANSWIYRALTSGDIRTTAMPGGLTAPQQTELKQAIETWINGMLSTP